MDDLPAITSASSIAAASSSSSSRAVDVSCTLSALDSRVTTVVTTVVTTALDDSSGVTPARHGHDTSSASVDQSESLVDASDVSMTDCSNMAIDTSLDDA